MNKLQLPFMRDLHNTLVNITNEHMGSQSVLFEGTLVAVYEHVHNGKRSCTRTAFHKEYSTDPIHRNGYVLEA